MFFTTLYKSEYERLCFNDLENKLKTLIKELNLEKTIAEIEKYVILNEKDLQDLAQLQKIHLYFTQNMRSEINIQEINYHFLSPVFATILEYSLLYKSDKIDIDDDKFNKHFLEAFELANSLLQKRIKTAKRKDKWNTNQIWLQHQSEQGSFFESDYFCCVGRTLYFYEAIPKLIEDGSFQTKHSLDIRQLLKNIDYDINALICLLQMPAMMRILRKQDKLIGITLEGLLNPAEGVELPCTEDALRNIWKDLSWSKDKSLNHREKFRSQSPFCRYPVVPYGHNTEQYFVPFIDSFLRSHFTTFMHALANYVQNNENYKKSRNKFTDWFGDVCEDYCRKILQHSFNFPNVDSWYTEERIKHYFHINGSVADFVLKEDDLVVVIESKSGARVRYGAVYDQDWHAAIEQQKKMMNPIQKGLLQIKNTIDHIRKNRYEEKNYNYVGLVVGLEDIYPQYTMQKKCNDFNFDWYYVPLHILEYVNAFFKANSLTLKNFTEILKEENDTVTFNAKLRNRYGDNFGTNYLSKYVTGFYEKMCPSLREN